MLRHYSADTGELGLALPLLISLECAAYSPNGLQIAVTSLENEVEPWNTQPYANEHFYQTEDDDAVSILAFSPCSRWIALFTWGRGVEVWDARSGSKQNFDAGYYLVVSIEFSSNGLDLAVGYENGDIRVWDTNTWSRRMVVEADNEERAYVAYPPGSSHLACCHELGTGIRLFDEKGKMFRTILKHDKWIESSWAYATTIEGFFDVVITVAWRPKTTELATTNEDGSIRTWKVQEESGHVSAQLLWGHGGTAFTAPGAILVGAVGLSTTNRKLLEQRGAIFESSSSANDGA
ncbi:MAG: WD40-repeat-containing domain protein [Linnemannia gamsii]|nr:MAG: WD40-repeat-containing domain protein [Linnemannia gamsii]